MTDVAGLHAQATRLILALRDGLERLEGSEHGLRPGDPAALARNLQLKLGELQVVRQSTAKRDVWKRKVEQVAEEADFIRHTLDKYGGREALRQREAADRQELMAQAELGRQMKNEMDEEAAVMGHIGRSKRMLHDMFETGTGVLVSMGANRERIKRAQRRLLDVVNSVGMGDSVLRIIERRQKGDTYLAFGGMAVVLLITAGAFWWWW